MSVTSESRSLSWSHLVIIGGGLLMTALWPLFTALHGPTSVNEDGHLLGQDPLFWGSMLSAVPSLLIAAGLLAHYPLLAASGGRTARWGYRLVMVALLVPAVVDLVMLSLGPPLLLPLSVAGLVLLAVGHRSNSAVPRTSRLALLSMAVLSFLALFWAAFLPLDVSDRLYGYRVYGFVVYVLVGAGWVVLGASLPRASEEALPRGTGVTV